MRGLDTHNFVFGSDLILKEKLGRNFRKDCLMLLDEESSSRRFAILRLCRVSTWC